MNTTQPELPPNPEAGAQQQAATPAPAAGEVGKLVAKLRRLALQNPLGTADPTIARAAALIEQQTAELATLRQQAAPVPVSERLPDTSDPSECRMPFGDCWWFDPYVAIAIAVQDGAWYMDTYQSRYTHWLPFPALPLPSGEATNG